VLISKPKICGFGMNFQSSCKMIFCGLSDSYEAFYQATRRQWRFGQKNDVDVHIVISELETSVYKNIKRKEEDFNGMAINMIEHAKKFQSLEVKSYKMEYKKNEEQTDDYHIMLGDSCERIKEIEDESIGYSVFSPPFSSLYTYSNSERDMGNSKNDAEFYKHFIFLVSELFRITQPGRLVSFHCMNLPTSKTRDGFIGIKDFRGLLIKIFQDAGFIYASEVCIWKDPVVAMQRTKALGLLNKQKNKDSAMSRQGIPDYVVTMRKPGENKNPIKHDNDNFPISEWQKVASPIWMDIKQGDTLSFREARDKDDEKHICPLQLGVIERCMMLWSNPGDMVFSPFMGIGSEGYQAVIQGRKFKGIELKESYYIQSIKNMKRAIEHKNQNKLF